MSERPAYVVVDWDTHFEKYESQRTKRSHWIAMPNKHDGKSFRRLMRMEGAAAVYGAWVLLLQVASKCPIRGVLADLDGPMDAEDLEDKTGMPAEAFERVFEVITQPRIGWMRKLEGADADAMMAEVQDLGRVKPPPAESAGGKRSARRSKVSPAEDAGETDTVRTSGDLPAEDAGPPAPIAGGVSISAGVPAYRQTDRQDNTDKTDTHNSAAALEGVLAMVCGVFDVPPRQVGYDARRALSELLPVEDTDLRLVLWYHSLPETDDHELKTRHRSPDSLIRHWSVALAAARAWAKKNRGPDFLAKKEAGVAWPEGAREWLQAMYPGQALPARFDLLPDSVRREWRAAGKKEEVAA